MIFLLLFLLQTTVLDYLIHFVTIRIKLFTVYDSVTLKCWLAWNYFDWLIKNMINLFFFKSKWFNIVWFCFYNVHECRQFAFINIELSKLKYLYHVLCLFTQTALLNHSTSTFALKLFHTPFERCHDIVAMVLLKRDVAFLLNRKRVVNFLVCFWAAATSLELRVKNPKQSNHVSNM